MPVYSLRDRQVFSFITYYNSTDKGAIAMNLFKIVDSHCDTLLKINSGETNFFKNGSSHGDIKGTQLGDFKVGFSIVKQLQKLKRERN